MLHLFKTSIGLLRILAFVEGISFLVLLFVAMPLKYYYNQPLAVKYVGQAHGLLFTALVIYTLALYAQNKWKLVNPTLLILLSSIIPFGTFYADYALLRKME